jgi:hypothetical protein
VAFPLDFHAQIGLTSPKRHVAVDATHRVATSTSGSVSIHLTFFEHFGASVARKEHHDISNARIKKDVENLFFLCLAVEHLFAMKKKKRTTTSISRRDRSIVQSDGGNFFDQSLSLTPCTMCSLDRSYTESEFLSGTHLKLN